MTVVKKKAVAKKKAAPKKAVAKKKVARMGIKRTTTTELTLDTTPKKKKKPTAVVPPEVPQVDIPEDTFKAPKDVDKYEDGFIMTIIITAAAAAVAFSLWLVNT